MKIAILNISIGNYRIFWPDFYLSCMKNFLPDLEKHFFVFTDDIDSFPYIDNGNISLYYQENMGWPFNTMKRFHLFNRIKTALEEFDYIFFINGNALFKKKIYSNIINSNKTVISVQHPGYYNKKVNQFPYERRIESNAYIPYGEGKYYVQGAFVGGTKVGFLEMCEKLEKDTEEDIRKKIIAVWHDESFLNKYFYDNKQAQILGHQYLSFEEIVFPYEAPIVLRDKRKYMDLNKFRGFDKGEAKKNINHIKTKLRNIREKILILIGIRKRISYIDENNNYIDYDINQ